MVLTVRLYTKSCRTIMKMRMKASLNCAFTRYLFIESEIKSLWCELSQGTMYKLCSHNMLVYVWFFS